MPSTSTDVPDLPTGTVTFLLTDVAGSTRMWESEIDEDMRAAIARHYDILATAVADNGGVRPQEQGEGDSIVAAFAEPSSALAAALDAQVALVAETWPTSAPVLVRMAVHTGEARLRDEANYAGQSIIRTARLRSLGHGGQVLVSGATRDLVMDQAAARFDLVPLGEHRLRDLGRPEQVWQLAHPDLPSRFGPLTSAEGPVLSPLPSPLTPFIGRQREIDALLGLTAEERLVVVTGAGGAGKTRLALEVGRRTEAFEGGIRWVELAPLGADAVEPAVRAAFGISEASQYPLEESVRRVVGGRAALLIVDNCEHVTDSVAPLIGSLLAACPELSVLATSRVSLGVAGELPWRVPALAPPSAVELFCDRARRARPSFELSPDNRAPITAICDVLDGIPLAIELAAARCRILGPQQILEGLSDALHVLAGGSRISLPRQQTLDASIRWSVDLLHANERRLLERLAVFVDGWSLSAAESVCSDATLSGYEIFDALDRLVDHCLVMATDADGETRFSMLETVRQFAYRSLMASGDQDALHESHAMYFGQWIGSVAERLTTADLERLLDIVTDEQGNLVAAFDHLVRTRQEVVAAELLAALSPIASTSGWVPAIDVMVGTLDQHADRLDGRGALVLAWGRTMRAGGRGDVAGLFGEVDIAETAARALGDPTMESQARVLRLVMMGTAGAQVVEDLLAEELRIRGLVSRSHSVWALTCAEHIAALQRGGRAYRSIAATPLLKSGDYSPMIAMLRSISSAVVSFQAGDVDAAIDSADVPALSPFTNTLSRQSAILVLGLAAIERGDPTFPASVELLRHRSYVEGNILDEYSLAILEANRALLLDDLDSADRFTARAFEVGQALGFYTFAADLLVVLSAAGRAVADVPGSGGVPVLAAAEARCAAEVAFRSGRLVDAANHAHSALQIERDNELWRGGVQTLDCLARILISAGRVEEGMRLLGATASFRERRGLMRVPVLERLSDTARSAAVDVVGEEAVAAAFGVGATLTIEAAADYAGRHRVARSDQTVGWDALTPTEGRVAALVADGLTNAQVASELIMGSETVKTHLSRVFDKIGVANRKELILAAARRSVAATDQLG